MDYPNDDDDEERPSIVHVHTDFQLISVPNEVYPPKFNKGKVIALPQGRVLQSEQGNFYSIGKRKNIEVKFGTVYEGRELVYSEELKIFQLKYPKAKYPELHIQIVNYHKYWAEKRSGQNQQCDDIMDELSMLQYIQRHPQHPNIARLIDCVQDDNFIYSIMEFGGDDLFNIIKFSGGLFTENHKSFAGGLYTEAHRKHIFTQILDGVEFLQSIGIYHRDLSVDNILYNPFTGVVKIIDFGMALHIPRLSLANIAEEMQDLNMQDVNPYPCMYPSFTTPTAVTPATTPSPPEELIPLLIMHQGWYGKPSYAPPEMYASQPLNGFLADNWSLGVVLYYLLTSFTPWSTPQVGVDDYFRAIIVDDSLMTTLAVTSLSHAAKDLLRTMLRAVHPNDRLKIKDIRAHEWLNED